MRRISWVDTASRCASAGVQLLAPLRTKPRRQRTRRCDTDVLKVLKPLWRIMDYPCGKRLSAMLLENEFKW